MSEAVERKLVKLLGNPTTSPYGNPIPGLDELGDELGEDFMDNVEPLSHAAAAEDQLVHVKRISEEMQKDEELMGLLRRVGALPGKTVTIARTDEGILIGSGGETAELLVDAARARGSRSNQCVPSTSGRAYHCQSPCWRDGTSADADSAPPRWTWLCTAGRRFPEERSLLQHSLRKSLTSPK